MNTEHHSLLWCPGGSRRTRLRRGENTPSVTTVQTLIDWLADRSTCWETAIKKNPVKATINRRFAEPTSEIVEGDEIAFVPITPGSQ